ncbi:cdp-glucose -dehydratase [Leptolyngbya sp. Heron Island J]|uniref:CDP-glucose 4,6-dehydratase n=1 Tax=Leptolyngbya sp. Heron Island J TaxID=1385935 RepID=UPI0003B9CD78|nr:CDP-glucose 4,6-dehydratase [Leptolyngbya sp. Heron Island J]ESA32562.1 cdp-glucose -dehydratase [Leptolyngbya sp. Heron Island J]
MSSQFWHSKRVLITGHTGFKGSWLSLWLQQLGASVVGYSLEPPTEPNLFTVANLAQGMNSIQGDIRDLAKLQAVMNEYRPEVVLHLAAQPLVRYSYKNPIETYATNVMGTAHVLEAIRTTGGVRAAVMITTDKCYENNEWVWGYREQDRLGGHDPYSNSKACAELVTAAYRNSYFSKDNVAIASARAGNVIGGGDWALDRLIPDMVRAFSADQPVLIRNLNAIRPWQHVLEPISGYLSLAEHLWNDGATYADGWNFGPNDEDAKPVSWIVEKLSNLWGDNARWQLDGGVHPHEATYLKLDCSKAKQTLGWAPQLTLATALEWTVEVYKAHLQGDDIQALMGQQIERFQQLSQGDNTSTSQSPTESVLSPV